MDRLLYIASTLLLLLTSSAISAQESRVDTAHRLSEITVTAVRSQKFLPGTRSEKFDTLVSRNYSSRNLTDLLAGESEVFVKSYSAGGLAIPSVRGTGAYHTAILWNGFNLQSPMNGLLDLSLIPLDMINSVSLEFGGASTLWGSGAVGGAVQLNNTVEFDKGVLVRGGYTYGSFSDSQERFFVTISKKRVVSVTRFFKRDARNDFSFINLALAGSPKQKLINAALSQYGFMQENYFKIKNAQTLSLRFWHQNNYRELPPGMTQPFSVANQSDVFYRVTADWKLAKEKYTLGIRAAHFNEFLTYKDKSVDLISDSHSATLISEVDLEIKLFKNQRILLGANNTYASAFTKEYQDEHYQNRFALLGTYLLHNTKSTLTAAVNVRQEFIFGGVKPFTASAGFDALLLKGLKLSGKATKNYRVPTFNDLYWTPGGNKDLVPETGFSEELGLNYVSKIKSLSLNADALLFNSKIDDWIMWLPGNLNIWSPRNVQSVWSRGVEYRLNVQVKIKQFLLYTNGKYQFAFSTNEKSAVANDPSLHKQLIYVPAEKVQARAGVEYKGFALSFVYSYSGYRYITSDNLQYLNPYQLGNIYLDKLVKFKHIDLDLFFRVNNVWNEQYQVIAWVPTPLRNYAAGLTITIHKPNKKTIEHENSN